MMRGKRAAGHLKISLAMILVGAAWLLGANLASGQSDSTKAGSGGKKAPDGAHAHSAAASREEARKKIIQPGVTVAGGWAMGLAFDPFDPNRDATGNDKQDLSPFVYLSANFGDGSQFSADMKVILANFGRLVNKVGVQGFGDSSGTSVRRAVITEFTLRTPAFIKWSDDAWALWNIFNAGFSLDAQEEHDTRPLDAASYWFTGPSIVGYFPGGVVGFVDLLVGTSEILTGVESFDFDRHKHYPVRIRPRVWFRFPKGFGKDLPLEMGFWGDLGPSGHSPDALTAYVTVPFFSTSGGSGATGGQSTPGR